MTKNNNTSFDFKTGRTPIACGLPLSLLALTDMPALTRDYAQLLSEPPEENRWFVMRGKEALPPQSFREVLIRLSRGEGPLVVLREAEAEQNPTPWSTLDHQASVSNRATALTAIFGFWAVVIFLGWAGIAVLAPGDHATLFQTAYLTGALAIVGRLSLPAKTKLSGGSR